MAGAIGEAKSVAGKTGGKGEGGRRGLTVDVTGEKASGRAGLMQPRQPIIASDPTISQ